MSRTPTPNPVAHAKGAAAVAAFGAALTTGHVLWGDGGWVLPTTAFICTLACLCVTWSYIREAKGGRK